MNEYIRHDSKQLDYHKALTVFFLKRFEDMRIAQDIE
jgi:hypothetical protein